MGAARRRLRLDYSLGETCGHLKIGHIIGQNTGHMYLISFRNAILGFN